MMRTQTALVRWSVSAVLLLAPACARESATSPEGARFDDARGASARDDRVSPADRDATVTFEDFAVGAIHGQHDWLAAGGEGSGAPAGSACAVYDHVIADNSVLLPPVAYAGVFGRRSLRISNAVTSGCYSDQTFSHRAADVAGEEGATSRSRDGMSDFALPNARLRNHFEFEWTIISTRPSVWQPGLELVASPARGDDHRMSWVQVADWSDGLAVVFAERSDPASPGTFEQSVVARGLDRRRVHTIRLTMDFVDGPSNDVARVFVDGALRHTGGSWETYYRDDVNGRSNFGGATPAVNRIMFRTGSDAHRGVPGDAAPATRGFGFLVDAVRVAAYSVARSVDDCRHDGWREVRDGDGRAFWNQGDCVSWTRHDR
jgi:hypothetical protein